MMNHSPTQTADSCGKDGALSVLLVSTSYPADPSDWKGRFIRDMVAGLANRQDICVQLWAPGGELPEGIRPATTAEEAEWFEELSARGGIAACLRRGGWEALVSTVRLLRHLFRTYRRTDCDLAHVNWLQNALPLTGTRTPLLVTVLGSDFGLLRIPGMTGLLRMVFRRRPTFICPNAGWMEEELERRFGDVAQIQAVPFGVHRRWFEIDRTQAAPGCWLCVSRITRAKIGSLFSWGEGMFGNGRELHLFGPMQEEIALPSWVIWHGPTHAAELAAEWFPRATGLLTLSHHDEGRPQVMLEAMAAGLPVIASALPAHRDIIVHRRTGWLVESEDELRSALETLEDMPHNAEMGNAARKEIKERFGDWDDCAARYADLYHALCPDK